MKSAIAVAAFVSLLARPSVGRSEVPTAACKAPQGVFGSAKKMDVSMEGRIFLLPKKPQNEHLVTLKDFDSLPSTGSVFTDKWDIPSRSFTEGFPGVTDRFDSGKSALRPEAASSLQQLAQVLLGEPGLPVSIEGHTDNVGSVQHNQTLSEQRAEAVKQWLTTAGRVAGGCITTRGFGATKPVVSNASAEGRQKNRRVEISIQKAPPAAGRG